MDLGIFERKKNNELPSPYNKLNICHFLSGKRLELAGYVRRAKGCLIRKASLENRAKKDSQEDHAKYL